MAEPVSAPTITWDSGTAYDFFVSLNVINAPAEYGLRPSWAAGIRSRLSAPSRMVFSNAMAKMFPSVWWISGLPQPKQARNVLELLEDMKPEEILPSLCMDPGCVEGCGGVPAQVYKKGTWDESDVEKYLQEESRAIGSNAQKAIDKDSVRKWLDWWSKPAEFGSALRAGLREYYESFFREEERRIAPDLERALDHARELASRLPLPKLFEELSQGVRLENVLAAGAKELRLAPCYWITPRILYDHCLHDGAQLVVFGARPPEASLIPGDVIPARLLLALEAMSDPTRLSILRAVGETPMTQAEIARKLRLRPPTISHHLKSLRLAGLIAYVGTEKGETRFAARAQQVEESCAALKDFLGPKAS
jgi:DNA-binding transcriptional ArsR family regulator